MPKRKTKKPQRQSTTSERREDNFDKGEEEFVRKERRRGANRNAALSIDDDNGKGAIGSRHASGSSEHREERRRGARQEFSHGAAGDETANESRNEEIRKQQQCLTEGNRCSKKTVFSNAVEDTAPRGQDQKCFDGLRANFIG